jgi:serine/threonine protein kinase/WD40 repeat protein
MTIEPGQTLLHYRLVEKIGEGGMGAVWKADDTQLDREVALKVLPTELATDPERRNRFEREAKTVAALNHPNIVTLHSVEEADGIHFITMELVEGQTLAEMLPRKGFDLVRLLEIAIPLADAVSRAHRAGITHRDLKPDNIMADEEGRLRVLDFGLAKLQEPSGVEESTQASTATAFTEEGRILGTVAYMSPEQAEGKTVDPCSDVFSLGTILYEMASGGRPFCGETTMSTIASILRAEPTLVTELNQTLPRHLGRIIHRCLSKDPDRRYQTALDLRNELEHLKAEIDLGELAAEPRGAAARPTRKSNTLFLLGVGAVMAIVALLAIKAWMRSVSRVPVYTPRPITSAIGWETSPSWSPEAEFIAFARAVSGSFDIVVQPEVGGDPLVRADGPGDETAPRWSPDGKYLAYVSSSEPGSFVYLVPPHGGKPRKLIDTNIPTLEIATLAQSMGDRPWSQDGKTLLVSRMTTSGRLAIHRVYRETHDAEQLSFPPTGSADLGASHSFDGERIVFQRRTHGRGALLTMSAAGGDPEELLADEFNNYAPAWRPGTRNVVFLSNRGRGSRNLWEIDVATGSTSQLTFESKNVLAFSVSAHDRIAYAPHWHDTFLFTVDVTTGDKRQLTSHTMDNFGARFSPDGQTVAYHSTRSGDSEIWLHHLDTQSETRVTDDRGWDIYPDWSPDGQRLIFISDRDGPFKIFIANSEGGEVRLLVDQPISLGLYRFPIVSTLVGRWSPDGEQIAYLVTGDKANALWTVQQNGDGARKLLDQATGFDWYRDSRHAVYTRQRGRESEMVAVELDTGREQILFVGSLTELDVSPDGSAVAFCSGRGHLGMGLAVLRLESPSDASGLPRADGEPEYLVRAEGTWHVHNGGWSADSTSLVYTQDKDYGDIQELVKGQ